MKKEVIHGDGKREIKIFEDKYGLWLSVCKNGWQATLVPLDTSMLAWLGLAVHDYSERFVR